MSAGLRAATIAVLEFPPGEQAQLYKQLETPSNAVSFDWSIDQDRPMSLKDAPSTDH